MKWYKHLTTSLDDPDISDAIEIFGGDGYLVFFGILELIGKEFDHTQPESCDLSLKFIRKKLQISDKKLTKILNFYMEKQRIFYKKYDKNGIIMMELKCNKLRTLSDNYTNNKIGSDL